jgi:hypothetical protein
MIDNLPRSPPRKGSPVAAVVVGALVLITLVAMIYVEPARGPADTNSGPSMVQPVTPGPTPSPAPSNAPTPPPTP